MQRLLAICTLALTFACAAVDDIPGEDTDDPATLVDTDIEPEDKSYLGGWAIGDCSEDIDSTGNDVGDIAVDFERIDQFGEAVRLHDFCDRLVLVVMAAMWSGASVEAQIDYAALFDTYADDGLMILTLLGENTLGEAPGVEDLDQWVVGNGATHPVLSDPDYEISLRYLGQTAATLPQVSMIGPGGEILGISPEVSEATIVANLP